MLTLIVTESAQLVDFLVEVVYVFYLNIHVVDVVVRMLAYTGQQIMIVPLCCHILLLICFLFSS